MHVHNIQAMCIPWTAVISWNTSGTAAAFFNRSLSLFHRKISPEAKSPQSQIPGKGKARNTSCILVIDRWHGLCFEFTDVTHRCGMKPLWPHCWAKHGVWESSSWCDQTSCWFHWCACHLTGTQTPSPGEGHDTGPRWFLSGMVKKRFGISGRSALLSSPSQASRTAAMVSSVWCWMTKQPPALDPCLNDSISSSFAWCTQEGFVDIAGTHWKCDIG